jgi:hypothetical protein
VAVAVHDVGARVTFALRVEMADFSIGMPRFGRTKSLRVVRKQCGGCNDDGREEAWVHLSELW